MFNHQTSPDTGNATSSAALPVGPLQLDLLGGPTTASCGPAAPRASRSPSRAKAKPRMTIGTCGPTSFASSVPDGPLSSWENRLRRRLARTGSTECLLTWKESTTPAGRSLSRLVPSTRPTGATVSGLWPTPTASLADKGVRSTEGAIREAARNHGPDLAAVTAAALWQTPVADDSVNRKAGKFNSRGEPKLSAEVKLVQWPTPTATDANRGMAPPRPHDTGVPLNQAVALQSGVAPDGSLGTTGKPAGSLNPEFVSWLMGFSDAWLLCAPDSKAEPRTRKRSTGTAARVRSKRSATPSSQKSPRK